MIGQQLGSPVDKSDSALGVGEGGDSQEYVVREEDHSHLNDDHIHIIADSEYEVLLSAIDNEDDISIYESIRDENQDILTKIEKLYTAFKSHEHHHGHLPDIPLLSIVEQESHSMTRQSWSSLKRSNQILWSDCHMNVSHHIENLAWPTWMTRCFSTSPSSGPPRPISSQIYPWESTLCAERQWTTREVFIKRAALRQE